MYDFKKTEQETLSFWKEGKIFEKSLESRKKAKKFVNICPGFIFTNYISKLEWKR